MRYLGGKTRLAKEISQAILNDTPNRATYIEPFIGGGSTFFETARHFESAVALDIQPDLILMYKALQMGWTPPGEMSYTRWQELRDSEPSPERAFAGFACSFGGRFFEGFARSKGKPENFAGQGRNKILRQFRQVENGSVTFIQGDYSRLTPAPGDVVYCDPPYAGTTQYTSKRSQVPFFDHKLFWDKMRQWRGAGVNVYVSEFNAPDDWTPIWAKQRSVSVANHDVSTIRRQEDKLFK